MSLDVVRFEPDGGATFDDALFELPCFDKDFGKVAVRLEVVWHEPDRGAVGSDCLVELFLSS